MKMELRKQKEESIDLLFDEVISLNSALEKQAQTMDKELKKLHEDSKRKDD